MMSVDKANLMQTCLETLPQQGRLKWIGIRPQKRVEMLSVEQAELSMYGILGDHYCGKSGKRSVTLIQAEHIVAISSFLHTEKISPQLLRRNLVIEGINLLALKNHRFYVGPVLLEMTGLCHPCTRMEENLGAGGYNAVRGHGGINARVLTPGVIRVNDPVYVVQQAEYQNHS